jgi:sec-independent protein translocase protein TatA
MGIGGIGIWELMILLLIIMVLFGTKKLRNIGEDLGGAIKGFRKSMHDTEQAEAAKQTEAAKQATPDPKPIDAQATPVSTPKETQRTS